MSTVYAQRSSAVRAAKKAAGPDQEWVILPVADGFTFSVLAVEEKQPVLPAFVPGAHVDRYALAAAKVLAETGATEAEHVAHRAEPVKSIALKPFQLAKRIVADMTKTGTFSRKEIMAAGIAAGIKYNTIDGAYHEMIVKPRNGKI